MLQERYEELKKVLDDMVENIQNGDVLAKEVLDSVVAVTLTKFYHKLGVGVEDSVSDLMDSFKQKVVQQIINDASSWHVPKTEMVIFPRNCRFYYTKGDSAIVVIEEEPKKRTIRYSGGNYNLPLPYVVFIFHIKNNALVNSYTGWRSAPLHSTADRLSKPILPNIHESLEICWGGVRITGDSISEIVENAVANFWSSSFNDDLSDRWNTRTLVHPVLANLSQWETKDTLFMCQLFYTASNDPTVEKKMVDITGHVDEPNIDRVRHRLFELVEQEAEVLFSKIIRFFKRTKAERFYPKDVEELLKEALKESGKDYISLYLLLQEEYNELKEDLAPKSQRKTQKLSPFWDEENKQ